MKTLLALGTLLLVGSSLGCAAEMEEGAEGQDVSASSAALLELRTREKNSDTCKSKVSYLEVTGRISKAAQKRINDVLRTEELPECDPSAKVDMVAHRQALQMNEMGILSVFVSHGRISTTYRTRLQD